jgi:hypothetical protein
VQEAAWSLRRTAGPSLALFAWGETGHLSEEKGNGRVR